MLTYSYQLGVKVLSVFVTRIKKINTVHLTSQTHTRTLYRITSTAGISTATVWWRRPRCDSGALVASLLPTPGEGEQLTDIHKLLTHTHQIQTHNTTHTTTPLWSLNSELLHQLTKTTFRSIECISESLIKSYSYVLCFIPVIHLIS